MLTAHAEAKMQRKLRSIKVQHANYYSHRDTEGRQIQSPPPSVRINSIVHEKQVPDAQWISATVLLGRIPQFCFTGKPRTSTTRADFLPLRP